MAAAVVSIPANKAYASLRRAPSLTSSPASAAPGGFTPTALNSSTDGGRDRSTSTLISPRKRMNSDVPDSAKRVRGTVARLEARDQNDQMRPHASVVIVALTTCPVALSIRGPAHGGDGACPRHDGRA